VPSSGRVKCIARPTSMAGSSAWRGAGRVPDPSRGGG